jgi:uncharacterized damage-inducible protein DinB
MELTAYLRIQVHANRLMNQRLYAAMAPLSTQELHAPRTGFFPSLAASLNHILAVDLYYAAALLGELEPDQLWHRYLHLQTLPELAKAQRTSDLRLVALANTLDAAACDREVQLPRGGGRVQRDRLAHVLAHLLMHQTHHRGQVHAMLSGTRVPPPQLDEFQMPSEAHLRTGDMAAAGWAEPDVYGAAG